MTKKPSVSVCIALFNGQDFICQQIDSILDAINYAQLEDYEIIVVDDCSKDQSLAALKYYVSEPYFRLLRNTENIGVVATFEVAICRAEKEIIYLCDQDDLWSAKRIANSLSVFWEDDAATLVMCNAQLVDMHGETLGKRFFSTRPSLGFTNLFRNRFIGCCICFDSSLKKYLLPFPPHISMHDIWIGLISRAFGRNVFIDEDLVFYRRHVGAVTHQISRSYWVRLRSRVVDTCGLLVRINRIFRRHMSRTSQ